MSVPARVAGAVLRRWRRILAVTASGIAGMRVALWVAKAVASASTVDAALNAVGLGAVARPFEEAFDRLLALVVGAVAGGT